MKEISGTKLLGGLTYLELPAHVEGQEYGWSLIRRAYKPFHMWRSARQIHEMFGCPECVGDDECGMVAEYHDEFKRAVCE